MVDTIIITVAEDVPKTEQGADATVTVGANTYTGKVTAVLTHDAKAIKGTITIEADGLAVA